MRHQGLLWDVRVVEVPDVGLLGHKHRVFALELKLGVSDRQSAFVLLRMPVDLGHRPLDGTIGVWVLEDHDGLGGNLLGHVLGDFTGEVLFKHVDLVVGKD